MPDLRCSYPSMNGSTTFTTSDYFGQAYGNGGKRYKILIVCGDNGGEYYSELSAPFETGTTILPTRQNPTFCENGLIFWNDDCEKYTKVQISKVNNSDGRVLGGDVTRNCFDRSDFLEKGEYYYATLQNIARGNYQYRYSKPVTTNVAQYRGKTDVLGAYWEGTKLCWIRYPGAKSYTMDMQADIYGVGRYSTVIKDIPSTDMMEFDHEPLLKMEMKNYLGRFPSGIKIRFLISALDSNGNKLSNSTTTSPTIYKIPKGDINHDGEVDRIDANLLSRYVAGWDGYESRIYRDVADLNGDGNVDRIDANILSRCVAGWDGYRAQYIK